MAFKKSVQKHVFPLYHVVSDIHRDAQLPHSQGELNEVQRRYQCNKLLITESNKYILANV